MNIKLSDCEVEYGIGQHGVGTRWTHESGAWVELIYDESPHHPLDDAEGIALAFREGDRYSGTADDYPRYPAIECPRCEGTGEDPDRFELILGYYGPAIGAGTEASMMALLELFDDGDVGAASCSHCDGCGEVQVDLETYFRVDRGARAIYEFSTGNHGEASAVMYVTDDDWTDPAGAAKAWGEEYEKWAEGDVWGIEHGGPGIETESVWGFIGFEYAKEAALSEFLIPAISAVEKVRQEAAEAARIEAIERAYWAARDVETVA